MAVDDLSIEIGAFKSAISADCQGGLRSSTNFITPARSLVNAFNVCNAMQDATSLCCFVGTWILDKAASDSLEGASALMSLGIIMRNAVDLLRGMHISIDGGVLVVGVFSLIEWFTFTEQYNLDGTESLAKRRDFRKGANWIWLSGVSPTRLQLLNRWEGSYAGKGIEEVVLVNDDELHVSCSMTLYSGKSCTYRQVFRRRV